ncbi:TetR/AcrR family transcriptional regulator [Alicyclobacillus sp. SO9]|uniref:TetR/AcrR family transcriptional regulator n=1 Tax=Alicyclobacillus sp. SO9 TaxID=2665646 RepID=UPI0018E8D0D5|nr:TetR/AcrR family transcriptional regulator [Alicyclobacillus sp. SO9]QQE78339.1 TetR/AcrR family transcriptional regulator [Alicyclobacillus sp. SO9]
MEFAAFEAISKEKQQRVINAVLGEFAKRGYKLASTNEIIHEANISKGLLFHYFHNKKQMFLYVYDYALAVVSEEMLDRLDFTDTDVLNRFKQMAILKMNIIKRYPQMYEFLLMANGDDVVELAEDLKARNIRYVEDFHDRILDGIDVQKFRKGLDTTKAISVAFWTMEHFTNRPQDNWELRVDSRVDYDNVMDELDSYLTFLRHIFYAE